MKLIFGDEYIRSYSDNIIRGDGIIDIELLTNEFVVFNLDGTIHEKIVFNEGMYLFENGTTEIIARKFIPNEDFFSLCFDSNAFDKDEKFGFIYFNGMLKKIELSKYIITYSNWIDYVKSEYIKLRNENLLKVKTSYGDKILEDSINHTYMVKEIINDELLLITTSTGCCKSTADIEGLVKWRNGDRLLVDICVID
jgi:hypothetical protein